VNRDLAAARAAFHAGDFEAALLGTEGILRGLGTPPFPLPVPGGLPEVDFLLDALGRRIAADLAPEPAAAEQGGDWILATLLYEFGGHTPLIRDLAAALPDPPAGLALTLTGHAAAELSDRALARTGIAPAATYRASGASRVETCRDTLRFLRARSPRRLFLLQHPDDTAAVAAAAALAAAGTQLLLVHHADIHPTAGLFLPGARVIDLTPRACSFTRHVHGLPSVWLPLTCPDPGAARPHFGRRGRLTTALSGSLSKTTQPSLHRYPEVVAAVLRATGGAHVHVGALLDFQLEAIGQALADAGVDTGRFIHVPSAPTLVDALRGEGVDLLVNTWPLGGARTAVEAMAAGVPMVWHSPHPAFDRARCQMAWPGAPLWRHPADLAALAAAADTAWLTAQSGAARRRYEQLHHPSRWRQFFADPGAATGEPLPDGFDATLHLPWLWETLLERATECDGPLRDGIRECARRQDETALGLAEAGQRLEALEAAQRASRLPWWRWRRR